MPYSDIASHRAMLAFLQVLRLLTSLHILDWGMGVGLIGKVIKAGLGQCFGMKMDRE